MKELDDFTVERLEKLIHLDGSGCVVYDSGVVGALARIALAAKTAEPVTWWTGPEPVEEMESFHDHETGSHQIPLVPALYSAPVLNSPELPDGWIPCDERMPEPETPVLIMLNGTIRKGAIFWEHPTFEEGGQPFKYWDDPDNDGQDWEVFDVTHWQPLPAPPTTEK